MINIIQKLGGCLSLRNSAKDSENNIPSRRKSFSKGDLSSGVQQYYFTERLNTPFKENEKAVLPKVLSKHENELSERKSGDSKKIKEPEKASKFFSKQKEDIRASLHEAALPSYKGKSYLVRRHLNNSNKIAKERNKSNQKNYPLKKGLSLQPSQSESNLNNKSGACLTEDSIVFRKESSESSLKNPSVIARSNTRENDSVLHFSQENDGTSSDLIKFDGSSSSSSTGTVICVKLGDSQHSNEKKRSLHHHSKTVYLPTSDIKEQEEDEDGISEFIKDLKQKPLNERISLEENFIKDVIKLEKLDEEKYCIDMKWACMYTSFLEKRIDELPPIDNSQMTSKNNMLKRNLKEHQDFITVNLAIWNFLTKLYRGGPKVLFVDENQRESSADSLDWGIEERETPGHIPHICITTRGNELPDFFKRRFTYSYSLSTNESVSNELSDKVRIPRPRGLENKSNFCFLNTILQCLFSFVELTDYFVQDRFDTIKYPTMKLEKTFCKAYSDTLKKYLSTSKEGKNYSDTRTFQTLVKRQFDPKYQHDTQEFLRYVLSELQDELNPLFDQNSDELINKKKSSPNPEGNWKKYNLTHTSIVDSLFAGQIATQIACSECDHQSYINEPFLDLSLPIYKVGGNHALAHGTNKNFTLTECLTSFFSEEYFSRCYKCEKCDKITSATKKCFITHTPKILVTHLKRFEYFPTKRKNTSTVTFPVQFLNIKRFCEEGTVGTLYRLSGFASHSGNVDQGHYRAYTKRGNEWIEFDDEKFKSIKEEEVKEKQAYLLFYERIH